MYNARVKRRKYNIQVITTNDLTIKLICIRKRKCKHACMHAYIVRILATTNLCTHIHASTKEVWQASRQPNVSKTDSYLQRKTDVAAPNELPQARFDYIKVMLSQKWAHSNEVRIPKVNCTMQENNVAIDLPSTCYPHQGPKSLYFHSSKLCLL